MKFRTLTTEEFLEKPVPEKIRILLDSLNRDPKGALFTLKKWRSKVAIETLVALVFHARALAATAGQEMARKEAWRCITLADGISDDERFVSEGNSIRLPRSFAETFPHLMEDAARYWASSQDRQESLQPSFVLQTTESDLDFRRVLFEKPSEMDYWPISFGRKYIQEDGSREQTLTREEIAAIVIRHCAGTSLPRVSRSAKVVTLGSCFAINLSNALTARGIDSATLRIEEVINTTAANRLFLDCCLNGAAHPELEAVVGGRDLSGLKDLVCGADLIVLTVGVAPVMEWTDTGKLCVVEKYRALLEAKRIRQRFTTVEENRGNIVDIVGMLKSHNPRANVCVTLSPVPLIAAVGGGSVVERDALSKSILKVAIDEARKESEFFYWPAFEAVKWIAPHVLPDTGYQAYGIDDNNSRHVSRWLVDIIVREFMNAVFE